MENGEKRSNIEILKFKAEKLNRCKAVCLISHLVKWRALAPPPLPPPHHTHTSISTHKPKFYEGAKLRRFTGPVDGVVTGPVDGVVTVSSNYDDVLVIRDVL